MKKIIGWFLASFFLFQSMGFAAAGQAVRESAAGDVLETKGLLAEVEEGRIRVKGQGAYEDVILHITAQTYIVDGNDGSPSTLEKKDEESSVAVYYGPRLTRSLPPQGTALAVVKGCTESMGMYMKVAEVEPVENGVRVLCSNRDRLVTITNEVLPEAERLKTGDELLVWYPMMTLSLPGQAVATKAVLLNKNVLLEIDAVKKTLSIHGQTIALGRGEVIQQDRGTVWLPLRTVAEELGYTVKWQEDAQSALLIKGPFTATATLDSSDYGRMKMRVKLKDSPQRIQEKTYVPLEFFSEVLGISVQINGK